jgi:GH35 family endo-1,4-beta-xylanase
LFSRYLTAEIERAVKLQVGALAASVRRFPEQAGRKVRMDWLWRRLTLLWLWVAVPSAGAHGQTVLNGSALALRSSGDASGTDWVLSENGYVGSYITLAAPGDVTIAVEAASQTGGGSDARMNVVVGDARAAFDIAAGFNAYEHTFSLPAGTHFVRTEYVNDFPGGATNAGARSLTVRNLSIAGATASNVNSDANALAAADTYIQHGRRGAARLELVGVAPGTEVGVRLTRHAFNWGANIYGTASTNPLPLANPEFTQFFKDHFNMVVPSRGGKWNNNEAVRDVVTLGHVDSILDFAEANHMRARMHNLIWGNDSTSEEQPAWVVTMLQQPNSIDSATGLTNVNALRGEIRERIDYYVGDGPGGLEDLSLRYDEVDVYNESVHTGVRAPGSSDYWTRLGLTGIAGIYDDVAQAVVDSGSQAKVYVNEYNILQNGFDDYGNWYREHIEDHQNADGDPSDGPVSGVGMQLYAVNGFSPAYVQQVLQNMSVTGLPQSITEFGVQGSVSDPLLAKQYVEESLRMAFGTPDMTTFMYWGFWAGATSNLQSASALANADWSLTDIGKTYEDMLGIQDWDGDPANGWTTDLMLETAADGAVEFTGFYGDLEVTVGGKTYALTLEKGQTDYALVVDLTADLDDDGDVDGDDLTAWKTAIETGSGGDTDGDGDADGADFLAWQRQLGMVESTPLAIAAAAVVPEPRGLLSFIAGLTAVVIARRPLDA